MARHYWSDEDYRDEALERVIQILSKIANGESPQGDINLYSRLPQDIKNPKRPLCVEIAEQIENEIAIRANSDINIIRENFARYNFEVYLKGVDYGSTIHFVYSPKDVRDLSKPKPNAESSAGNNLDK